MTDTPPERAGEPEPDTARSPAEDAPSPAALVRLLVRRELSTTLRLRTYVGLWLGLTGILLSIAWLGGGFRTGYTSMIVDLLTPLELLVPVVAFAFGYRAVLDDRRRGILDVLRTYPLSSWQVVAGAYIGRAVGLVAVLSASLLFLVLPALFSNPYRSVFYATHAGGNSIGLFVRFILLTVCFALVVLAISVAVSALVSTTRSAVLFAGLSLLAVLFVADIALVFGLSRGIIGDGSLVGSLAISPLSAYRGLVLETTITATDGTGPRTADPLASAAGLCVYGVGALAVAARAIRR